MPTPPAPTAFTLTSAGAGKPRITLAWSHTGTDLSRFEVLRRKVGDTSWIRAALRPKADLLVSGTNYQLVTGSPESNEWTVRALSGGANDAPSARATAQTFSGEIDGAWLLPQVRGTLDAAYEAWIGASTPGSQMEESGSLIHVPSREEGVASRGVLHLEQGSVEGLLLASQHGKTADQWLERVVNVVKQKSRFDRIWLVTPRYFKPIEPYGPVVKEPEIAGGRAWRVTLAYRELSGV